MSTPPYVNAAVCLMIALSACQRDPNSIRIIARVASPNGQREAITAEDISGGATVGPYEEVYLETGSAPLELRDRVAVLERACHLTVRWFSNEALEISYFSRREQQARKLNSDPVDVRFRWFGPDAASGC